MGVDRKVAGGVGSERGGGLITLEARGLTFQRDRRYTRLAHLRDFELWPETAVRGPTGGGGEMEGGGNGGCTEGWWKSRLMW